MIKIIVNDRKIKISGHAEYADYGKDIVCASVSSIVYTTVNGILNIDESAIEFTDTKNEMTIKIPKETEIIKKLIQSMLDLLADLEKQYPKNIKIVKGE
ncbi:MAG: ribosomal-processing cysteine protease Prp [Bacilli bacterium]|nr:ribosomal-processing cysteine protease Prp [Bacilli bacterium]